MRDEGIRKNTTERREFVFSSLKHIARCTSQRRLGNRMLPIDFGQDLEYGIAIILDEAVKNKSAGLQQ